MTVVEIADANGVKKKIDVQESGEGLEQLVADLGVKTVAEAIKVLLEGSGTIKISSTLTAPAAVRLSDGTSGLGTTSGRLQVADGGVALNVKAENLGTEAEAEATANGGIIGLLKRLRKLLEGSGSIGLAAGSNSIGTVVLGAGSAEAGKVKVTELPALVLAAGSAAIGKVIVSSIEGALPAGTNNIGKVTVAAIEAGSNAIGKLAANAGVNIGNVGFAAASHEGVESKLVSSAASTNSTLVKNSAGKLFGWHILNKETVPIYLKIYAKATAPTVGTDTPVMIIGIPAGAAANVEFANGIKIATGIGLGLTKGSVNTDTTAVAAEGVILNLLWV